jgi:hypothetical protein
VAVEIEFTLAVLQVFLLVLALLVKAMMEERQLLHLQF